MEGSLARYVGASILLAGVVSGIVSAGTPSGDSVRVRIVRPFTGEMILPDTEPLPGVLPDSMLHVNACRNQFEAASFVLKSVAGDIDRLQLAPSALRGEGGVITADNVDIRLVKVWYQGGTAWTAIEQDRHPKLVPELLLRNDDLVEVDNSERSDYLHCQTVGETRRIWISDPTYRGHPLMPAVRDLPVRDSARLLPFRLIANRNKQVWVTVHVPGDAKPGVYRGAISVAVPGRMLAEVPVELRVYPFALSSPRQTYSIYYRGQLRDREPTISSEFKSAEQMRAELRDMINHGISNPSIYQAPGDDASLYLVLKMRRAAGISNHELFYLGFNTGDSDKQDDIDELGRKVTAVVSTARKSGVQDVYFYGVEEVLGEKLLAQRSAWKAVHDAGGRVFVAGYQGTFEAVGDLLDLYIAKEKTLRDAAMVHRAGKRIFIHKPQGGIENPALYRKAYGLDLWRSGYDGAMPYAYQAGMGSVWNDFDDPKYRDHNFTYPTVNGVIDTIAWEGFREGVDDVRYVTTLENMVKAWQGRDSGRQSSLLSDAEAFLQRLRNGDYADLDAEREQTAEFVSGLASADPGQGAATTDLKQ